MTAVNIFRLGDSVVVMTDGAHYLPDGTIGRLGEKTICFPDSPAVLTSRGRSEFWDQLQNALPAERGSFDSVLSWLPIVVQDVARRSWHQTRQEIAIAGWSNDRARGESYLMFTADHIMGNGRGGTVEVAAFELVELPHFVVSPSPPPSLLAEQGVFGMPAARNFEPIAVGIRIMEAQRRTPPEAYPTPTVGGFIKCDTITKDGVQSEIIHHWREDVVGQPITISPEPASRLNRRQRRALGR